MAEFSEIAPLVLTGVIGGAALLLVYASAAHERRGDYRRILTDGAKTSGTVVRIGAANRAGRCKAVIEFGPDESDRRVVFSQVTTAQAVHRLGLMPGSGVVVHFLARSPKTAFVPALARADHTASSPPADGPDGAPPEAYFVSFTAPGKFQFMARTSANPLRWVGQGTASVTDRTLRFVAKRARPFRSAATVNQEFPLAEIANVEAFGNAVMLELREPDHMPKTLKFWTVDARHAAEIAAKLPSTKTGSYTPAMAQAAAFLGRLQQHAPTTPVTTALIAINVAIFVIGAALGAGVFDADTNVMIRLGSDFTPLTVGGQWWRLFTSAFLHFGLLHVGFNMYALYVNGPLAERIFGSARYLVIYLCAGLAGSAASLWWHPLVNGAGASGAIFGIFGALLAFFVQKKGGVPTSVLRPYRNSIALFIFYNLANGAGHSGIDNAAHLGGLVSGFLVGFLLARPLTADRQSAAEERTWVLGIAALVVGAVLTSFVRSPSTDALLAQLPSLPKQEPSQSVEAQPSQPAHAGPMVDAPFWGVRLGETRADVARRKGRAVEIRHGVWYYHSVNQTKPGLIEITFRNDSGGPNDRVSAIFYEGDSSTAPPELPFLNGLNGRQLTDLYRPPVWSSVPDGDSELVMFSNGLTAYLWHWKTIRYGIQDFYGDAPNE